MRRKDSVNLKAEAESLRLGLLAGVVSVGEVIRWADSAIVAMDQPEVSIIDVALSVGRSPDFVARQLESVPGNVDHVDALRSLLASFLVELEAEPEHAWDIARRLYRLAASVDWPESLLGHEPYSLDDAFDLAAQDIGSFDSARSELRRYLQTHALPRTAA